MDTFHFDLVSPAKLVFTGDVIQVDVPGVEGDFGVLAGHAPVVAMIKPGILTVFEGGEAQRFVVLGGFAEVSPTGMTVLADAAYEVGEIDRAEIAARAEELGKSIDAIPPGPALDRAAGKLESFLALERSLHGGADLS
ncbi:MAG TPA: F0F1 ATP synthase subunit epsilon [Xanthobacteraceae bacterium]|jgi:F-type H+-transporting ATPase subunit epsilon